MQYRIVASGMGRLEFIALMATIEALQSLAFAGYYRRLVSLRLTCRSKSPTSANC